MCIRGRHTQCHVHGMLTVAPAARPARPYAYAHRPVCGFAFGFHTDPGRPGTCTPARWPRPSQLAIASPGCPHGQGAGARHGRTPRPRPGAGILRCNPTPPEGQCEGLGDADARAYDTDIPQAELKIHMRIKRPMRCTLQIPTTHAAF